MLTWQQSEFLLKGVYLGILVTIGLLNPRPDDLAIIALFTVAGLVLFLTVAAVRKIREGYRVRGRWLGFIIFLLLETPWMVYAGLLVGLMVGTGWTFKYWHPEILSDETQIPPEAMWPILGGAVLGGAFYAMRNIRKRLHRFYIGVGMIALLVGGAFAVFNYGGYQLQPDKLQTIGMLLLLGIPGFYLLTFAGLVEESEIEIAAMCAALGFSLWAFLVNYPVGVVVVVLPLGLFFVYTTRYLPALRVFKHTLRGMSYRQMGQTRLALISLGRALQFDPHNVLARAQLWDLHRRLDFAELKNQPELVPFLDFDFCLERVSEILDTRPSAETMREATKMLDLIATEQPAALPICAYWRAVAYLHERNYDEAARQLLSVLQLPQMNTAQRHAIHFSALYLATHAHPEMARRIGATLLPQPGQRMDAIAAVEAQLARTPQDPTAWDLKRQLYSELSEREYWSLTQPDQPAASFNYEYVQQLGLALVDDPAQWRRGCEYLRIAAHGMPLKTASIYIQIAQTHEKHGDHPGMWANYQKAMQIGRSIGVQNLQGADRDALFVVVKKIGDQAIKENHIDVALDAFKFYSVNESAGIETYRTLADLFERRPGGVQEKKDDIWQALHCTEHALTYNAEDKDLKERKDRYYYSTAPDDLKARYESVQKGFDPQYCRDKATWVLEKWNGDFDLLDWAAHLSALAIVAQPGSLSARLLKARVHRLKGEIPETIATLETIRQNRPEKFASKDDEQAWYFTHRMLGDLYLDEKPAEALACFIEFKKSDEAGADTSYKMGKACEALGDFTRAAACYEEVTAYEQHPLYYEARDALDRVKRGAASAKPV